MRADAKCEFDARRPYVIVKSSRGPVAQLGARFHGMEEVDGSNPSRSTKFLKHLAPSAGQNVVAGVQMESSRSVLSISQGEICAFRGPAFFSGDLHCLLTIHTILRITRLQRLG